MHPHLELSSFCDKGTKGQGAMVINLRFSSGVQKVIKTPPGQSCFFGLVLKKFADLVKEKSVPFLGGSFLDVYSQCKALFCSWRLKNVSIEGFTHT